VGVGIAVIEVGACVGASVGTGVGALLSSKSGRASVLVSDLASVPFSGTPALERSSQMQGV